MVNQYTLRAQGVECPLPDLSKLTISAIAIVIHNDWKNPYFAAKPYIEAMSHIHTDDSKFGAETAESVCLYFLSNAGTWRGNVASQVKAELKRRFKIR